jgi:hypothetical protein
MIREPPFIDDSRGLPHLELMFRRFEISPLLDFAAFRFRRFWISPLLDFAAFRFCRFWHMSSYFAKSTYGVPAMYSVLLLCCMMLGMQQIL